MKITIIGAGNMGGAIAGGLAAGNMIAAGDITVTARTARTLDRIKECNSAIVTMSDNRAAVESADLVGESDRQGIGGAERQGFGVPNRLFVHAPISGYGAHEDPVEVVDARLNARLHVSRQRLVGVTIDLVLAGVDEHGAPVVAGDVPGPVLDVFPAPHDRVGPWVPNRENPHASSSMLVVRW